MQRPIAKVAGKWSLGGKPGSLRVGLKEEQQCLVPHRSDTDSSTDDPVDGAPLAVSLLKLYSGLNHPQLSLFTCSTIPPINLAARGHNARAYL